MEPVTLEPAPHDLPDFGDSPPPKPDDDLWLEYGRKMVQDGPAAIRSAATSLMTGLSALQGIYLGILGFAKFVPDDTNVGMKTVYVLPLLFWIVALFLCLRVMMTDAANVNLNAPDQLREQYARWVERKQGQLVYAFVWLCCGMLMAIGLVLLRANS